MYLVYINLPEQEVRESRSLDRFRSNEDSSVVNTE